MAVPVRPGHGPCDLGETAIGRPFPSETLRRGPSPARVSPSTRAPAGFPASTQLLPASAAHVGRKERFRSPPFQSEWPGESPCRDRRGRLPEGGRPGPSQTASAADERAPLRPGRCATAGAGPRRRGPPDRRESSATRRQEKAEHPAALRDAPPPHCCGGHETHAALRRQPSPRPPPIRGRRSVGRVRGPLPFGRPGDAIGRTASFDPFADDRVAALA